MKSLWPGHPKYLALFLMRRERRLGGYPLRRSGSLPLGFKAHKVVHNGVRQPISGCLCTQCASSMPEAVAIPKEAIPCCVPPRAPSLEARPAFVA